MASKNTGHIFTVSKLTGQIKSILEEKFPFIWISGEISNLATPVSGHSYFTLKDDNAIISSVMFKNQKRNLKFNLENGLTIVGLARLSVYEPRGSYQLIFEHVDADGAGSAQIAFEQLKSKLSDLGFFDDSHKKTIPFLPEKVSVVTSGSGAALQDILNIAQRRFDNSYVEIVPVQVQGDASAKEIVNAIRYLNAEPSSDVIILARGGGSLEDLASFNSEPVAQAIFDSTIPIVTGIGHETDFTIADFTADLRAPTPSAAAELVFPEKRNLMYTLEKLTEQLEFNLTTQIKSSRSTVELFKERLKSPQRIIDDYRFRLEDNDLRLSNAIEQLFQFSRQKHKWASDLLEQENPLRFLPHLHQKIKHSASLLSQYMNHYMDSYQNKAGQLRLKLDALNPTSVLKRGFSITRKSDTHQIITRSDQVRPEEEVEVVLNKGRLTTKVKQVHG